MKRQMSGLSWRVGVVVAALALVTLVWPLAPRIVAPDAGHHVVVGGALLPAALGTTRPDAVTWFAAPVEIRNRGLLPVRITNARALSVDDRASVSIRVRPPRTGTTAPTDEPAGTDGAVVGRGGAAELWVTIGQPGCAADGTARVERGLRGVAVDVTALGLTRTVTLDVDLAAYVESPDGPLPACA